MASSAPVAGCVCAETTHASLLETALRIALEVDTGSAVAMACTRVAAAGPQPCSDVIDVRLRVSGAQALTTESDPHVHVLFYLRYQEGVSRIGHAIRYCTACSTTRDGCQRHEGVPPGVCFRFDGAKRAPAIGEVTPVPSRLCMRTHASAATLAGACTDAQRAEAQGILNTQLMEYLRHARVAPGGRVHTNEVYAIAVACGVLFCVELCDSCP